ncbi:hypothetical protein DTO207G8_1819 [Paecilomyces variotii]|nr:hypothetical protein DTO207G8_1819 [Paecilomyces variotii]KAJ9386753.1 hypothetical protein DTO063F5_3411 [Paecilomyces variotii]
MAGSPEDSKAPEQQQQQSQRSSPPPQPKSWHEEENPFVAFRRYADEQISSVLQSVMGLPSAVSQPTADHWMIFADDSKYKDNTRQRRSGEGDNAGTDPSRKDGSSMDTHYESDYDRSSSSSKWPRWSRSSDYDDFDRWRWHTHRSRPFDFFSLDSFFDKLWFDDRFPFSTGLFNPFWDTFEEAEAGAWPIPYLLFSPYSPLHLERQSRLRANRDKGIVSSLFSSLNISSGEDPKEPHWRDAFEDLLRLENGKPMLDRDTESSRRKEKGSNWLRGLVERGSLGDRWKYIPTANGNGHSGMLYGSQAEEDNKDNKPALPSPESKELVQRDTERFEPVSELDLYDRFLQDIEAREREFSREFSQSPLLRLLHEERQRYRDEIEERRRRLQRISKIDGSQDNESWLDLISGGNKHSVPETTNDTAEATAVNPATANGSTASPSSVVVSTMTSTERRTLPDGTVQTKTVKTKRFADGREESNESVEVLNPQHSSQQKSESGDSQISDKASRRGWFWKE